MRIIAQVGLVIALLFLLSLLCAIPCMLLWDWLMPSIFGLREVTLFEAWGLCLLSAVLFKSSASTKSSSK